MQPERSKPAREDKLADNELLKRYRQGDAAAMETLLARWERPVLRLLLRLSSRDHDLDDLRQEVFLRVVKAAERYRSEWAFSTLLYRIVLNVARDARRRLGRRPRLSAADAEPLDGRAPPAEAAANQEAIRIVAAALESLPDELRSPLVLRHYGNLTFQQTAEVLGEPPSTIKSRVQAALRRLRAELKKHGLNERETS